MEIHEVKIGDVVSFKHKGKTMKGKIIHRHDSKNSNASLAGHVNVQGTGDASYPVTIHAAKLTPVPSLKEEDSMDNLTENIENLLDHIHADENIEAENAFDALMQHKINELLSNVKIEVAQDMFNTNECADCEAEEVDEALKGNQHKIDANKNGKVDAHDFKLLRKKKGVKEDVEDLDEISRLESGEQPLYKEYFIIQDLIREVYESLSIKTGRKNIKASIKKGCEAPISVFADKEKIRQVVINIVSNATKYGKQDGTIVAGIYQTDGRNVLIEFSDDGIGIAEEHLSRIFERFYRTDRGRSRDVGGTGLGLAICKHIIEAHQQTIHVRSKLDVGTTIGFTLSSKKE